MDNKNKQPQALLIITLALILLCSWSFFDVDIKVAGFHFKKVSFFSSIITQKDTSSNKNDKNQSLFADFLKSLNKDSIVVEKKHGVPMFPYGIVDYAQDSIRGMDLFFKSLQQTKKGKHKTRIAYFGDSMIEGDLLTRELRELLQIRFGGGGVGFVPITSPVAGFRQTIIHTFSENWTINSLTQNTKWENFIGLSGYVFNPLINPKIKSIDTTIKNLEHSWVKYTACPVCYGATWFNNAYLYYGPSDSINFIIYKSTNSESVLKSLNGKDILNKLTLSQGKYITDLDINFYSNNKVNIYGVSFEPDTGVILDNYAYRGNSGLSMTVIPPSLMQKFSQMMDYDLVIVHYGLNVVGENQKDFSWYENGMKIVMNQFKQCFKNASVLMIGVNDKSTKKDNEMVTDNGVPILVETQKRIADSSGVCFWNLYEAMGGYNSMVAWADADTALANKDYTHLNYRGASKVASMLFNQLMKGYNEYESKNK
jgi:hypothetical protein